MIKLKTWFPGSLVLLALVAGCGSDSGSSGSAADFVSSCTPYCNKLESCTPAITQFIGDCNSFCTKESSQQGTGGSSASSCDFDKVKSQLDECTNGACSDLTACSAKVSQICPNLGGTSASTGTGGASGVEAGGSSSFDTGGTTGAGNTSGTSTGGTTGGTGVCAPCAKSEACCPAYYTKLGQPTTACSVLTEAGCESQSPANQTSIAQGCNALLVGGAAQNIPACMQ